MQLHTAFLFGDKAFHLQYVARMPNKQAQDVKLALLNAITRYCMEHSVCRQQIIAKYFDGDGSEEKFLSKVRDCTQEAGDVLD